MASVSLVERIANEPLVTVQIELIRWLPLYADAIVPFLKDSLILVEIRVATPPLEDFEALHAFDKALVDLRCKALAIWISLKPKTSEIANEDSWVLKSV